MVIQPSLPPAFQDFDRSSWADLTRREPLTLSEADIVRLRALGEPVGVDEARDVYLPLACLLLVQFEAWSSARRAMAAFLGRPARRVPFVVGIAGSVAAGKSTAARVLRELLAQSGHAPAVSVVPTDGFLLPNAELERLGLLTRKGWPESYDVPSLLRFLVQAKAGDTDLRTPMYSHTAYDVLPGQYVEVGRPDILILEGLTLLQPPVPRSSGAPRPAVSDRIDASIYIDAAVEHLRAWYGERFLSLRDGAFQRPDSYFHRYAELSDDQALDVAAAIWREVNEPNLLRHVLPTRDRASIVLDKGADHRVHRVRVRI